MSMCQNLQTRVPASDKFLLLLQTATYTFVFPNLAKEYQRVMLPLLDLCNHKGIGSNTFVTKDVRSQDYEMVATRPIK